MTATPMERAHLHVAPIRPLHALIYQTRRSTSNEYTKLIESFDISKARLREQRRMKQMSTLTSVPARHREEEQTLRAFKRDSVVVGLVACPNRPRNASSPQRSRPRSEHCL